MKELFLSKVYAATVTPNNSTDSINDIIANALTKYIVPLAAALAVGFVIYGGVLYMTSGGDPEKTAKAKKTILWALAGVFLIVFALLIVKWVGAIFNNQILR